MANKRAQAPDRWESIHQLAKMESVEAIEALLVRFTYHADPSITDAEEKDAAFDAVVAGGERSVGPVRAYLVKSETISWPLRMLDRLLPPDEVVAILIETLAKMDTEYERDPERKLQLLSTLEERHDVRSIAVVKRFLEDVNETARFNAVGAIFAQDNAAEAQADLVAALAKEDSVRVRTRVLEGFAARGWSVDAAKDAILKSLPPGFMLDPKGVPKKR
ncbi:MAG: HEAT repeat domain-containing protein [Sandaracinaceae bacterium]|nr:HEAT repeat domain-containing protein [Sandaracinaceae bacterium]